jgi:hypothetical protein
VVKRFDEVLNLNDVAIVGHSDFLRRVVFRFEEYSETWRPGYGNSRTFGDGYNPADWEPDYNEEYSIFVDATSKNDKAIVAKEFDQLETLLTTALAEDNPDNRVFKVLKF